MKKFALALLAGIAAVSPAYAAPITYTFSGTFDGFLNGSPFANTAVTLTGIGDTDTLTNIGGIDTVQLSSLTADAGGTTFDIGSNYLFGTASNYVGFGNLAGEIVLATQLATASTDGVSNYSDSSAYQLGTPFTGNGFTAQITNATGPVSFSAVTAVAAVPETATWAMMIGGFGFIGGALRRRRAVVARVAFA